MSEEHRPGLTPTAPLHLGPTSKAAQRILLVVLEGKASTYLLPAHGSVVMGRGHDADLVLDHESVSRRHARLHVGDALRVEDLGSFNGTLCNGRRLAANELILIGVNDVLDLGAAKVTIHDQTAATTGESIPTPRAFTARVEQEKILINDPAMVQLFDLAARAAGSTLNIFVHGETGSGKEVVADYIQSRSERAGKPFLKLNCAALTESLLESELFGHAKGAFTGAASDKTGLLASADGGIVFLDEVAELPLSTQAKLLRVVEDKAVMPVGALQPRSADVRFISATNRDLRQRVREGSFREDLLFRLAGMTLVVPPLRERPSDIEVFARRFLAEAWTRRASEPPRISEEAMAILRAHPWPGNVRELRNAIERAVVLAGDGLIMPEHLPSDAVPLGITAPEANDAETADMRAAEPVPTAGSRVRGSDPLVQEVQELERRRIVEALALCAGNQTQAARRLGLSRAGLVRKLDQYHIPRPRRGPRS